MYKNWGKFHQRIKERGGTVANPHPVRSSHPSKGKRRRAIIALKPPSRHLNNWIQYILDCQSKGTEPRNIPDDIRSVLVERGLLTIE
jgi:hypothetical protein